MKVYKTLQEVIACDPTVNMLLAVKSENLPSMMRMAHCIVVLTNQRNELIHELIKLREIAPKKVVVDGQTYVWHCPTALIPETKS